MPAHEGSHQSATADAIAKAALQLEEVENVSHVYEWIGARRLVYEVQGTDGTRAFHDGPTYVQHG